MIESALLPTDILSSTVGGTPFSLANLMGTGFLPFQPLIAQQVAVQFGPAGLLGLCLVAAGAGLYLLRSMRPELARDYDIFFSAIGLLCGGILFFNGWRLDPILMFGQVLLAGSAVFFGFESIRMRSIATGQARRNTRVVDDDRPVSSDRVYRAELDELGSYPDDRPPMRRIRGGRDGNSSRNDPYEDDLYSDSDRLIEGERPRSSRRSNGRDGYSDRPSRSESNRRRPGSRGYEASFGDNDSDVAESSTGYTTQSRRRPGSTRDRDASNRDSSNRDVRNRIYDDEPPAPPRRRSRRDNSESPASYTKDEYVDYKPISSYDDYSSSRYDGPREYDDEWGAS